MSDVERYVWKDISSNAATVFAPEEIDGSVLLPDTKLDVKVIQWVSYLRAGFIKTTQLACFQRVSAYITYMSALRKIDSPDFDPSSYKMIWALINTEGDQLTAQRVGQHGQAMIGRIYENGLVMVVDVAIDLFDQNKQSSLNPVIAIGKPTQIPEILNVVYSDRMGKNIQISFGEKDWAILQQSSM